MENSILEVILDEVHESTNGSLKLLKVLNAERIYVEVDYKLFLILHEIFSSIKIEYITSGQIEKLRTLIKELTIKLPDRAEVNFTINESLPYYHFKITPQ